VLPFELDANLISQLETEIRSDLQGYARLERVAAGLESPSSQAILAQAKNFPTVRVDGIAVQLVDRRIVGADWLTAPKPAKTKVPKVVFSSLKGGVGRSTALCVLAAHFSRRGRRVLAVDFDLEAPGIGTMLLHQDELPKFGTLDYVVENGISGIDDSFLADMSGDSFLGADGARVTVLPAVGSRTMESPGDALAKISRAYVEDIREDGSVVSLSEQVSEMIGRFEATEAHDVVLVDSRAVTCH
jgi:Mrp family chromosome partitioning ATPase